MSNKKEIFNIPFISYLGTWKNIDVNSMGIIKVKIESLDFLNTIEIWGSCTPEPCEWGKEEIVIYTNEVCNDKGVSIDKMNNTIALSAIYEQVFAKVTLIIKQINSSKIELNYLTEFLNDSERNNLFFIEFFEKVIE